MKWLKLPRLRLRRDNASTEGDGGRPEWMGSARTAVRNPLVVLTVVAIVLIIGMVASFFYAQDLNEQTTQYNELIVEQRQLAEEISTAAVRAAEGQPEAYDRLQRLRQDFQETLDILKNGDPQSGLPPLPDQYASQLEALEGTWRVEQVNLEAISASRESVEQINEFLAEIDAISDELLVNTSRVVDQLVAREADSDLIQVASRQLWLLQRALGSLEQVRAGGAQAQQAAEQFARDAALYGRVLDGLLEGSARMNIQPVQVPEVRATLRELATNYPTVRRHIDSIKELAPELQLTSQAASELRGNLDAALAQLGERIGQRGVADNVLYVGIAFGIALLITLAVMGYVYVQRERRRLKEQAEQNQRNQRAILRLLDELSTLADGDLSTHATVTEDITGAIADSVNSAIDALRGLVTTINATAEDVARAAERTQTTAIHLAEASNQQAREIAAANEQITEMASSMERVAENARGSAEVARKSVTIASNGAETVRRSISGMDSIREQIQETSKRIKRLGDSSQEIGDIIGVINDIAEQTNILALNAAIQASTAGEAGRGFAVVADEVQRLAERASDATKRVEALIKTIQNDTNEAVQSMEQSTAGVVSGTQLAEEAGGALGEIESVSNQIAELIQQISQEAEQQAATAVEISEKMNVIQGITIQTSDGTSETATSIGELTALSKELRDSVTGFKLPEELDPRQRRDEDEDEANTVEGGTAGLV